MTRRSRYILLYLAGACLWSACQKQESQASCKLQVTRLSTQKRAYSKATNQAKDYSEMVYIDQGILETIDHSSNQKKSVAMKPYYIDKHLVTVAEYEAFVKATGYRTEAEVYGNSAVFVFDKEAWEMVAGADFRYPFGPKGAKAADNHPATQISWNDAQAYAQWKGKRLPSAAEWEWAASAAGKIKSIYAWGNRMQEGTVYKANFWQGTFPSSNTQADGFAATSPVGHFGSNILGITDMGGNVWQWTTDDIKPTQEEAEGDTSLRKLTKGGSFLCDPKVCHGFKILGHSSSTPETGMVHTGFRCVKDVVKADL